MSEWSEIEQLRADMRWVLGWVRTGLVVLLVVGGFRTWDKFREGDWLAGGAMSVAGLVVLSAWWTSFDRWHAYKDASPWRKR